MASDAVEIVQIQLVKTNKKDLLLTLATHVDNDRTPLSLLRDIHFAEMCRTSLPRRVKVKKHRVDSILIKGFDIKDVTLTTQGRYSVQVKGRKDAKLLSFILSLSGELRSLRQEKRACIFTAEMMEVLVPSELELGQWTIAVTSCPNSNFSETRDFG